MVTSSGRTSRHGRIGSGRVNEAAALDTAVITASRCVVETFLPCPPVPPCTPPDPTAAGGGAFGESSVRMNGATSTGCTVSSVVKVAPPNALWKASNELGPSRA